MLRWLRLPLLFASLGLLIGAAAAVILNVFFPATPAPDPRTAGAVIGATATPAAQNAPPPNSLVFTQQDVNDQVAKTLRDMSTPVPVRDVQVALLGQNRVEATGKATVPFQGEVPLTVNMTVTGASGKLSVNVESVKAAGVALPQPIVQQLVGQVMSAAGIQDLNNIALPQGYESLTVEQGRVVVRKRT
jgi:hypothetical protein